MGSTYRRIGVEFIMEKKRKEKKEGRNKKIKEYDIRLI
jgi:hypothetical protein